MQQRLSKHLPQHLLIILILLLGSIYLFQDSMRLEPAYMHSWTQSDRLAIAMNFQENGFDFFHPATYNLLTKDGVTQVDFPIHDYTIALISSISGLELPLSFRLYNLIFFLFGMFFYFKACRLLGISSLISILSTVFLATLPFVVYYQNGFLPSIPSFAAFCIGLFYLIRSKKVNRLKDFYIAVAFLSLAALARIPFSIFLIALTGSILFPILKGKPIDYRKLLASMIGIGLVIGYFLYNRMLAEEYGSMFLSTFRTADDAGGIWEIILASMERWSGQLLSPFHWLIIIALLLLYIKARKKSTQTELGQFLNVLGFLSTIGVLAYFLLMSLQFIDHDYYYIDSFIPLISLLVLPPLSKIEIEQTWFTPLAASVLILSIGMYSYARSNQDYRYGSSEKERIFYHYQVFERSAEDLDNWGVNPDDTVAVFDISSTNLPFVYWKKRGYTSSSSGKAEAQELLGRSFDYAFLIDSFKISDSYFDYPEIAKQLAYLKGNGELSMYRKSNSDGIAQFFKQLYANGKMNFDDLPTLNNLKIIQGAERKMLDDIKGYSLKLSEQTEYALTSAYLPEADHSIKVSVQFEIYPEDSLKGLQLVFSSANHHYAFYLENEVESFDEWQNLQFHRSIPSQSLKGETPIKVYFWNPTSSVAYIDNYEILIYE